MKKIEYGYLNPCSHEVSSFNLVFKAYAFCPERKIVEASLFLNKNLFSKAQLEVSTPLLALAHPHVKHSAFSGFEVCAFGEDLLKFFTPSFYQEKIHIKPIYRVTFEDGEEINFLGQSFYWFFKREKRSTLSSYFSSCYLSSEKGLVIEGFDADFIKIDRELIQNKTLVDDGFGAFCRNFSIKLNLSKPLLLVKVLRKFIASTLVALNSIVLICKFFAIRRKQELGREKAVVFVSHNLSAKQGAPKVLFEVIKKFRKRNQDLKIIILSSEDGELGQSYQDIGVDVVVNKDLCLTGIELFNYKKGLSALHEFLSQYQILFFYVNTLHAFWGIDLAKRLLIKHVFWAIHESEKADFAFRELPNVIRLRFLSMFSNVSDYIFVSKKTSELFKDRIPQSSTEHFFPNGVDLNKIEDIKRRHQIADLRRELGVDDEFVISIIGTTAPRKGQDVFIREMAMLKKALPEQKFRFYVVGAIYTEFLEQLKDSISLLRLDSEVRIIDETKEVHKYFLVSNCIVIASRQESAPLVTLEAFAYEIPLVSTTVFGLAEQIQDGINALSFNLEVEGDLAEKVINLVLDNNLRKKLIVGGLADVNSRFNLNNITDNYCNLLESLVV